METLPPEMVVEVGQYLTPRDLASCSAVCQSWRDTFNNDSLWQQHCDPSLVEPLEKTPCVVEPRFVSPEVDNSTLTSISYWRMAFLREKHLWKNYKRGYHKKHDLKGFKIKHQFLSNTLLMRCFENRIEIWEVSTFPASIIASVNLEGIYYFKVYRRDRLLVSQKDSIKVFHVDPSENNVIELVHDISVDYSRTHGHLLHCVSGSTYIHVNDNGLTLDVIDLENGIKIKSESCPVMRKGNQNATISKIYSSLNSEYVIVIVHVTWSIGEEYHCYVYSVGQLAFSSGPIFTCPLKPIYHAINGDYLAFSRYNSLEIYNCFTLELVSKRSSQSYLERYVFPLVFNDGFVYLYRNFENLAECYIEMFSLTTKTWTTVSLGQLNNSSIHSFYSVIINNKFIECYSNFCHGVVGVGVWEASGQTLKRSDIPAIHGGNNYCHIINESFTRRIGSEDDDGREWQVYYYW